MLPCIEFFTKEYRTMVDQEMVVFNDTVLPKKCSVFTFSKSRFRSSDWRAVVLEMPLVKNFFMSTIVGIIFQSYDQILLMILCSCLIVPFLFDFILVTKTWYDPLFDKKNFNNRIFSVICPAEVGNFIFRTFKFYEFSVALWP